MYILDEGDLRDAAPRTAAFVEGLRAERETEALNRRYPGKSVTTRTNRTGIDAETARAALAAPGATLLFIPDEVW